MRTGAVWISLVMLRGALSKLTAWVGITMHALDLLHVLFSPFVPKLAAMFMIIAGLGYPVWLWLVRRRLRQIGNAERLK